MTDYPCLSDTDSIMQALSAAGYEANVITDASPSNGLEITDAGLHVRQGVTHSARIFSVTSPVGIVNNAIPNMASVRWDTTAILTTGTPNHLRTSQPGLWLFGASMCANVGAVVGSFGVDIEDRTNGNGVLAYDSTGSPAAYAPGVAESLTMAVNPTCIAQLPAQCAVACRLIHNFGAGLTLLGSSSPPTAVAGRIEMAGTEFWAVCLRPA